jgi:dipeptidase E
MKLILASSGFRAPESVQKCIEFVGKPANGINFAVINEAMIAEYGDHRWFLDDMDSIRNNFGGNIEFVNLQVLDINEVEKRLNEADVIFVAGGNSDYLSTVYEKTGFSKILPKLLKTKVYIGSSAGSLVLGHRPYYKTQTDIYQEKQYTDKYQEIVDFTVLPHLHSPYFDRKGRGGSDKDGWVIEDSENENVPVYAISDDAAVVVDGNKVEVVGKNWLVANNGKIINRKS